MAIIIGFWWEDIPVNVWESLCQLQGLLIFIYILNEAKDKLNRTFWALMCALGNVELISDIKHQNHDINHLDFIHMIFAAVIFLHVVWKDTLPLITEKWKSLKMPFGRHLKK